MNNYKKVRSVREGILVNRDYYNYLKKYKKDLELEKKLKNKIITKKEYKYLDNLKEKKALKECNIDEKLIEWEDIKSWNTTGKIGKTKISLQIKNLKKDLEPDFISNRDLINSLEKYCFGKSKVDKTTTLTLAKYYLYFIYFIIFILCLYMFISIIK